MQMPVLFVRVAGLGGSSGTWLQLIHGRTSASTSKKLFYGEVRGSAPLHGVHREADLPRNHFSSLKTVLCFCFFVFFFMGSHCLGSVWRAEEL